MAGTKTGSFGIGFRRIVGGWQEDIETAINWAGENGFACIDVLSGEHAKAVAGSGLAVGSADLPDWQGMLSPDAAKRKDAVAVQAAFIGEHGDCVKNFFTIMLPEDPSLPRKDNFAYAVESYGQLLDILAETGTSLSIEGWPGPGALCCTPETYREFMHQLDSDAVGINYDPSHLIRVGVDPLRFLKEFGHRVVHVHGKDTEIVTEALYELGHEQQPALTPSLPWGGGSWRYCIPGYGRMLWTDGLKILEQAGYGGMISIELEDGNYNGSEEGEKRGLLLGKQYLEQC